MIASQSSAINIARQPEALIEIMDRDASEDQFPTEEEIKYETSK